MTGLVKKNEIDVETDHGLCKIELLFGSVTKLPPNESVDVLVVSAFPGDYSPTPSSVIGALQRDLQISVKQLSRNKEEDLRSLFSCWWSKPLPRGKGFNRILCFEGAFKRGSCPPMVVGEVFRSLVSLCKNKDIKVVMPLLAAGDQVPIKYDIYLSYSAADRQVASKVQEALLLQNKGVRIFAERQTYNNDEAWQEEIYEVMVSCARVITLLSPRFLEDGSCVEQYNIALCCSRNMRRDYLAPLYVDSVQQMPTYMCLIQYVDCRPVDQEKISQACYGMIKWLEENLAPLEQMGSKMDESESEAKTHVKALKENNEKEHYDLFISYSHQNSEKAEKLREGIASIFPNWKIFIDVSGLKTGTAWQNRLYSSIESSNVVMALISPSYILSKVCQEEFNLALALHRDPSYDSKLLSVLVEDTPELPVWCASHRPFDCKDLSKDSLAKLFKAVRVLHGLYEHDNPLTAGVDEVTALWRKEHYTTGLPFLPGVFTEDVTTFVPSKLNVKSDDSVKFDILISYHSSEKKYGDFLVECITAILPTVRISFPKESKARTDVLDEVDMVIPLLSSAFIHSPELMDELNTALCRHRFSRKLVLFPVLLEELPREPAYLRLLFCLFSCSDSFWTRQKLPSGLKTKITASSAVCLRAAATVITYVICSAESVSGYFKTLFSVDELMTSRMQLGMKEEAKLNFNPLLFTETNTGHMVPRKDSEEDDIATNEVVPRGCHGTTFPLTNGIVEEKNLLLADITKTEVEIAADSDYVSIDSSKLNRPKIDTTTENGVTDSTNVLMMSIFNPGQLAEDYEHYTEQRKADAEGAVSETNNVVASESYSPSEQKTPTERKNKKCVSFEPPSSDGDTAAENETDKNLSPVVTDSDYENDIKNEAKSSNLDQGDSMVLDQDQLNEEKVPQQESENSPDSMGNKTSAERTVTEERDLEERAGAVDIQRAPLRKKMHRSRTCSIC